MMDPAAENTGRGGSQYRMDRMERDIVDIKNSMIAIQSSVSAWQLNMGEAYLSRREFREYKRDTEHASEQFVTAMVNRIAESETRGSTRSSEAETRATDRVVAVENRSWALVGGLALSLLAGVFGLLRTIPPLDGH